MIRPGKMFREIFKSLFKKPVTIKYPAEEANIPDRFRGRLKFEPEKCIGCKICVKDCPADAIIIEKIGEKFEATVDLDKCIYCAQCVDSCPKKALHATTNFELAQLDRRRLKVKI
jgi:formate hydrogenlyase subunit 6/NADH:ubiquinone oxidoreductase subunit I